MITTLRDMLLGSAVALSAAVCLADQSGVIRVPFVAAHRPAAGTGEVFIDAQGVVHGAVEIRLEKGRMVAAGQPVSITDGQKVVAQTTTQADGSFQAKLGAPGKYVIEVDFDALTAAPQAAGPFRQVKFQDAAAPAAGEAPAANGELPPVRAPEPGEGDAGVKEQEEAIGTAPNGNEAVFLDADGTFRFLNAEREVARASNDEIYLDKNGVFRGIVTYLDERVVRRPLPGANVYLLSRGQVIARTVARANGSFSLGPLQPGGYSIIAEYGYEPGAGVTAVTANGAALGVRYRQDAVNGNGNGNGKANGNGNGSTVNGLTVPSGPEVAWEREAAGLPWQHAAGQLACQRLAVRPYEKSPMMNDAVTELRKPGNPAIIRVAFRQPGVKPMPTLHLSPIPFSPRAVATPLAGGAGGGGLAGGAAGGGGGIGAAGAGGFGVPPFFPSSSDELPPASSDEL